MRTSRTQQLTQRTLHSRHSVHSTAQHSTFSTHTQTHNRPLTSFPELRDSSHTDRRRERPNSAPEEPSASIADASEAPPRRLSAGQSRGSGMMSLWQNRQPRRLKPKKMNLPAKGESSRSQSTRFSQRQCVAREALVCVCVCVCLCMMCYAR